MVVTAARNPLSEGLKSSDNEKETEGDKEEAADEEYALDNGQSDKPSSEMNGVGHKAVPDKIGKDMPEEKDEYTPEPEGSCEYNVSRTNGEPPDEPVGIGDADHDACPDGVEPPGRRRNPFQAVIL